MPPPVLSGVCLILFLREENLSEGSLSYIQEPSCEINLPSFLEVFTFFVTRVIGDLMSEKLRLGIYNFAWPLLRCGLSDIYKQI